MKILEKKYPLGSLPGQKTPGRYIDGILHQNLKILAKNIIKDMTFLGIISSSTLEVGTGKALKKGSNILMSDGSWKKIEDIKIGDKVISPSVDGRETTITNVIGKVKHKNREICEIRKSKDNSLLYSCCTEHNVPVRTLWRKSKKGKIKYIWKDEIYLAEDLVNKNERWFKNYCPKIITSPIITNFEKKDFHINPYFMGLYLGDGRISSKNIIEISNPDKNILNWLMTNTQIKRLRDDKNCYRIFIENKKTQEIKEVCGAGSYNKKIPKEALTSSYEYRKRLFEGLLDTDSYIEKSGLITYTTASKQLSKDVFELVKTLGCRASIKESYKNCQTFKEHKLYYNVYINVGKLSLEINLLRKKRFERLRNLNLKDITNKESQYEPVRLIKTSKKSDAYCIEVDSKSKLYITDNFCVTHNSVFVQQLAEAYLNEVNQYHGLNLEVTMNNIVFRPRDIIERSFKVPQYSVIICDEWEDANYWSELGITLRQFFRKCRQLNLFILIIIPNFFQLPMSYAISRSVFFIDIRFSGEFDRGYFSFYNFAKKKSLFIKGKKTQHYGVVQPNFTGRFGDGYVVNEADYRLEKLKDLKNQEDMEKKPMTETQIKANIYSKVFEHFKGMDMKRTKMANTELSKAFGFSEVTGRTYLKNNEKNNFEKFEKDKIADSRHNVNYLTIGTDDGGDEEESSTKEAVPDIEPL